MDGPAKEVATHDHRGATLLSLMAIQAVVEYFSGATPAPLKYMSLIVFLIATVSVAIFNKYWRWLWRRVPLLSKIVFPDLNGTWKGTLHSNWKDPRTGSGPGPIDTTIWIRQTLLSISVQQQTKESPSRSTRMFVEANLEADSYRLWYSYDNKPHANVSPYSPDHEGVCRLEMHIGLSDKKMSGQYYTGRSTAGNLLIERISLDLKDPPGRVHWRSGSESHPFRADS
ncbi:hypothetical protein ACVWXO_008255 [Bradyrhizobium sp. LM2.7]